MNSKILYASLLIAVFAEVSYGFGCHRGHCHRDHYHHDHCHHDLCHQDHCHSWCETREGSPICLPVHIPSRIPVGRVCTCHDVHIKPILSSCDYPKFNYNRKIHWPLPSLLPKFHKHCDAHFDNCHRHNKQCINIKSCWNPCDDVCCSNPCDNPCC